MENRQRVRKPATLFGRVARAFQCLRDGRKLRRDFPRDAARAPRRIERERVEPELLQPLAQRFIAQIAEPDAVRARIGERRIGGAGTRELGIQLDRVAHVHHDDEGRAAFRGGKRPRILLRLAAGAQHGVVEAPAVGLAQFLRFEHEGAAAVQIDEARGHAAVAVPKRHAALEHIGVVARVFVSGFGLRQFEQRAQLTEKQLIVRALAAARGFPAGDESVNRRDQGRLRRVHWPFSSS